MKVFKKEHLTRDERARVVQINRSLQYFRSFAGSTPASREWASNRYWALRNEKHNIQEDAYDRCREQAIKTACEIIKSIVDRGGIGTPNEESEYPAMVRDFEKAGEILKPWGFEERGHTFVNLDRLTMIRHEWWPSEEPLR